MRVGPADSEFKKKYSSVFYKSVNKGYGKDRSIGRPR